ncbi:MAG: nickel-dependent hydrogenase large subunit, partial [Candidatus Hadarchaeales archaeon]
ELLRDLLIHGEMVESHALHVFALALPDFLGFPSVVHMAQKYPREVKGALQLKKAGNLVHNILTGREVHGMNERVGGFATIPSERDLEKIKEAMQLTREFALLSVKLFSSFELPEAPRSENTFIALDPGKRFGYFGERHVASDGESWDVHDYRKYIKETTVKHSRAKHSSYKGKPFMVGALARIRLFGERLEGEAKELFKQHKDKLDYQNSLSNNLAQALELVHSVDRCISDVEELLSLGLKKEEPVEVKPKAGTGTASVEAPRGILIHSYKFDAKGRVVWADVITPTAMNAANVDKDFRVAAPKLVKNPKELERTLEMIARAYDPCISCATHLVRIKRI